MQLPGWAYRRIAVTLADLAALIALADLAITVASPDIAAQVLGRQGVLGPDMAVALLLSAALTALTARRRLPRVRNAILAAGLLLGLLMSADWLVDADLSLAGMLGLRVPFADGLAAGGALVPAGIAGYLLLLLGAWLAGRHGRRVWIASQILAFSVSGVALFSTLGWLLGPIEDVGITPLLDVPVVVAATWLLLVIAIMLLHPTVGPMRVVDARGLGSAVTRRLLVFAVLVIPALSVLRQAAENVGLIGHEASHAVFTTVVTLAVVVATFLQGGLIRRFETRELVEHRERLRLQAALSQAHRLEAVGLLAGGIAHDFNNLLTAIGGYADVLGAGFAPESPEARDVGEIRAATVRAANLTRQLLTFAGRQLLSPANVDLRAVVGGLAPMLHRLLGEDVVLSIDTGPEPLPVFADPGQLEQVIVNLAVNARTAMPAGGQLRISCGLAVIDGAWRAAHPLARLGRHAVLSVADKGTGIPPEILPRIFEPFFSTRREQGGTGLGLATVAGIAAQTGGWLEVESEMGRGTTFCLYLPLSGAGSLEVASLAAPSAQPEVEEPSGHGQTILLAEDEEGIRALAARILRTEGYRVVACASGEEALDHAADLDHIDLLLTDVIMPGMSGPDLAEALRQDDPGLRVMYMSGYPEDRLGDPGSPARSTALLAKPYAPAVLVKAVREALEAAPPGTPAR